MLTLSGDDRPRRGTAARELRIINDGSVLVQDGRIVEVGSSRRLDKLTSARHAEEIDATGRVVLPGFIDASTSLLCGPPRYGGEPFSASVGVVREWSAQRMELMARNRLRQFVRGGTTTLSAACGYGLDEATELKALRVLCGLADRLIRIEPTFRAGWEIPPEFADRRGEYMNWLAERMIPLVKNKRAATGIECVSELEAAVRETGLSFRTRRGGHLEGNGVEVLTPGHAPAGSGPIALSTGFDATASPLMSMQPVMWLACRYLSLTPEEAVTAATINAAHALGIADHVGSIEPGKDADLLVLQASDYRDLCWYAGVGMIGMVIKGGMEIFPRLEVV